LAIFHGRDYTIPANVSPRTLPAFWLNKPHCLAHKKLPPAAFYFTALGSPFPSRFKPGFFFVSVYIFCTLTTVQNLPLAIFHGRDYTIPANVSPRTLPAFWLNKPHCLAHKKLSPAAFYFTALGSPFLSRFDPGFFFVSVYTIYILYNRLKSAVGKLIQFF